MRKDMLYFKVVTDNMQSLGLRKNFNIFTYFIGKWKHEPRPQMNNKDFGGIWCCKKLSSARALQKYFFRYGKSRIFQCKIGKILYENSYRTKTDKIKLILEQ